MSVSRDERICIIGAGAAGLSAALYLREAGFRRVTVLEREDEVGGKCRTFERGEGRWELGAVLATTDYRETLDIMKRVGMAPWKRPWPLPPKDDSFVDRGLYPTRSVFPGWFELREFPIAVKDIARYHLLAGRWPGVFEPGHDEVPDELADPFSSWVERYRMQELAKLYSIPFTAYGYGYYDEVPAAYVLKFFDPGITRSFLVQDKFFYWKEGAQEIWRRLARELDVRTGIDIGRAVRGDRVEVAWTERGTLAAGREEYDRLILACPLDDALAFLDGDEEERALVAPIVYTDYRVRVVEARGLRVPGGFAPGRFRREDAGRPLIWDESVRGAGISTFYTLADGAMSDADIERNIEADIRTMGGEPLGILASVNWKYFPHVGTSDYRGGYYRRFEARQGARRTYLAGEIASFSTVERTVGYSRELVRRFFE